jgi:hypothetical protein
VKRVLPAQLFLDSYRMLNTHDLGQDDRIVPLPKMTQHCLSDLTCKAAHGWQGDVAKGRRDSVRKSNEAWSEDIASFDSHDEPAAMQSGKQTSHSGPVEEHGSTELCCIYRSLVRNDIQEGKGVAYCA